MMYLSFNDELNMKLTGTEKDTLITMLISSIMHTRRATMGRDKFVWPVNELRQYVADTTSIYGYLEVSRSLDPHRM